jgi:FtsH-binding integral membrane protein
MMAADDDSFSTQERAAKATTDILVQLVSSLFDRAAAYTTLITAGGYAGAFSIWAFTSEHLSRTATALVALLLGLSLLIFVAYEIYKMIVGAAALLPMARLLNPPKPPDEFLREFQDFETARKRKGASAIQIAVWIVALVLSVMLGLSAMAVLFYNMLAIILGWPLWP